MGKYFWIASALGLVFGCAAEDPEPAPRTREEFCRQWANAACSAEVVSVCQAADATACRLSQQTSCVSLVPDGFADDQADACLDAVGAAYADADLTAAELLTVLRLGPPCDKLVRGPKTRGQLCDQNSDCDAPAGLECVIKGSATNGTCEKPTRKMPGLSCAAAHEICTDGFYCNGSNCIEAKSEGEPCATDQECGDEAYCNANSECEERLKVGSACVVDNECASGVCFRFSDEDWSCLDRLRLSPSEPACDNLR